MRFIWCMTSPWFGLTFTFTTGCASFVTPTNDEGLPYDRGEWHDLKAWRVNKVAYIEVDKKWTGL